MLTRGKDYYIVETFLDQEYPDKVDSDTEARGQMGVNKHTYWVTNDLQ